MLVKLLGLLDIICGIVFMVSGILPKSWLFFFGMLLASKGFIFLMMGNSISAIDTIGGFYLGFVGYGWSNSLVTGFFVIYLLQKGLLSFLSRG